MPRWPDTTFEQRLWSKIRQGDPEACWPWIGAKDRWGYGSIRLGAKALRPHREAYQFTYGMFADDLAVLHRCDDPSCCNPAHLWLGTIAANNADMGAKGRHGQQRNPRVKKPEEIAKWRATCAVNDSHRKRWETRRAKLSRGHA